METGVNLDGSRIFETRLAFAIEMSFADSAIVPLVLSSIGLGNITRGTSPWAYNYIWNLYGGRRFTRVERFGQVYLQTTCRLLLRLSAGPSLAGIVRDGDLHALHAHSIIGPIVE